VRIPVERCAEPTDYWLSALPETTAPAEPVGLANIRWRTEHAYRELKHGLSHFKTRIVTCHDPTLQTLRSTASGAVTPE
jgi:hypothetical protein